MADTKPMPYSLLKGDEKTLDTASIQSAIRVLGISQDQTAELQGYIKRSLSEERSGARNSPVELLVIQEFQREWCIWGKERLIQTQDAIRECIIALRLGIPLIQSQRPFTPSGSASNQPSVETEESPEKYDDRLAQSPVVGTPLAESNVHNPELNDGRPGPSTRDTPTQTEGVHSEKDPSGYHIRHLRGLHHGVLEIRDVPAGNPRLVVVENSPYLPLSAVEYAADEGDENNPILDDKLLPVPTAAPHLAVWEPVPCQPPHLPMPTDHEIERAGGCAGIRMQSMCELLYGLNNLRAPSTHPWHNRPLGLGPVKRSPAPEELTRANTPPHQLNDTAGPQSQTCSPLPITDAAPSHPTNTLNPTQRRLPRAERHCRPVTYPNETTIVQRGALRQRSSSTPHPRRALIRSASDTSFPIPSTSTSPSPRPSLSQFYTPPSQPTTHSGADVGADADDNVENTATPTPTATRPIHRVSPLANPPMTITASAAATRPASSQPQPHHHHQQQQQSPHRLFSSSAP